MTIVLTTEYIYAGDGEETCSLHVGAEGIVLAQIKDSTRASFEEGIFTIPNVYLKTKEG